MPDYRKVAAAAARKYGIDPNIFLRQINQESGFNPNARSSAGAIGIAQFMPATARGFGIDPTDPNQALDAAAKMDAQNLKKYGSYEAMLSAYNSGRPDAYKDPNFAGGQTYHYVRSILDGKSVPTSTTAISTTINSSSPAATSGSSARQQLIQGLIGSLSSYASGQKQTGFQQLSNTINVIHSAQAAQQEAAQYGTQTTSTKLSNGQVLANVNPNSPTDKQAIQIAESYLGTPYKWGGAAPGGFDCSGLLQYTWNKVGVKIPRTSQEQWKTGRAVGPNQLQPGDAVFFVGSDGTASSPGHVGMYIGGGKYIEAPHTGDVVKIANLASASGYIGARRFA